MASTIIYALLGGILPALLWLHFWLREDKKHPEPRRLIRKTFLLGMLAVILVLPLQKGVEIIFPGVILPAIILWAIIEEVFKFGAGYFGGLRSVDDNEPVDPIIYMITAALGFVALENALFILGPLVGEDIPRSIVTANLRFIGASLLHVVTSGIIGVAIAFSFYQSRVLRRKQVMRGLLIAIVFHVVFNLFILNLGNRGTLLAFLSVWVGAIGLLWAFEKAKTIAPPRL
jgi:RsiW-degrading membrane proteinase PrsW (M82 family)